MPGAVENLSFFQPISNLTTQRMAYNGDQRTRPSMRNMAFDRGLRRKMLITPFCERSQDGHYK